MKRKLMPSLAVLLVSIVSAVGPAEATDLPSGCSRTDVKYSQNQGDFQGLWWVVKDGVGWWDDQTHWTGGSNGPIKLTETPNNQADVAVNIGWQSGSGWGFGICDIAPGVGGVVELNSTKLPEWHQNPWMFRSAVAHEFGHALGFSHVGHADSYDGQLPVMATCRGYTYMTQDDWAGAEGTTSRTGNYFGATANSSFEFQSASGYWATGNTQTSSYSGGVDGSNKYLSMTRQGANSGMSSYIFSTTRLADNQGHTIDWITGRANYKKSYYLDYGYVTVVTQIGKQDYPTGETCGWPDFHGFDGQERKLVESSRNPYWAKWYPKDCFPPNFGWGYCTTGGWNPEGSDVFDARIWVYNRMRTPSGALAPVGLDRVRVLVDF